MDGLYVIRQDEESMSSFSIFQQRAMLFEHMRDSPGVHIKEFQETLSPELGAMSFPSSYILYLLTVDGGSIGLPVPNEPDHGVVF